MTDDIATSNAPPAYPQRPTALAVQKWRRGLTITGVVMIAIGVLAIIMPVVSSFAVTLLIGAVLTFIGLLSVLFALAFRGSAVFAIALVSGLFPLLIGLYLLFFPTAGLIALTTLLALIFLLTGITQVIFALDLRGTGGWFWALLSGLISVVLALLIFAALPEVSRVLLGLLLGIDLISTGLAALFIGRATRSI